MKSRRSFGMGMLIGIGATVAVGAVLGAGRGGGSDGWFVTGGDKGMSAVLWKVQGGRLSYADMAEIPEEVMNQKITEGFQKLNRVLGAKPAKTN